MNADGSGKTQLTQGSGQAPNWSPARSKVAFFGRTGGIGVINPDGSGEIALTSPEPEIDTAPNWSPDGSRIAFMRITETLRCSPTCFSPAYSDVYTMNADGTRPQNLTTPGGGDKIRLFGEQALRMRDSGEYGALHYLIASMAGGYTPEGWLVYGQHPVWTVMTLAGPGVQAVSLYAYKNAAQFCKAERDFLGNGPFAQKYGGGPKAYGKCVSQSH